MAVVLDERAAEDWMNPGERDPLRMNSLLVPAPDDHLVLSPATSLVNSVKYDGPELLAPDRTIRFQRSLSSLLTIRTRLMVAPEPEVSGKFIEGFALFPAPGLDDVARSFRTARSIIALRG